MLFLSDFTSQRVLIFDCQTTGTNSKSSYIIEAGWGIVDASTCRVDHLWKSFLVKLPEGVRLSPKIQSVTGINSLELTDDAASATGAALISYEELCNCFFDVLESHPDLPIVIHYAQFEKAYIARMCEDHGKSAQFLSSIQKRVVCTYRLSKRWFPYWNSYSLRAVSGILGCSTGEKKRVLDHLSASWAIWKHLARRFDEVFQMSHQNDVSSSRFDRFSWLQSYLPCIPEGLAEKKFSIHDHLRSRRLSLPNQPGIYRMLDTHGKVLYIGKAKNLKHRVNSYFRGRKSKGSHLNEMLMRVNDFSVRPARSHLEAVIDESNLIKRHDPPYNRLLRKHNRIVSLLRLYELDLPDSLSFLPQRVLGPFPQSWIHHQLKPLFKFVGAVKAQSNLEIWGEEIDPLLVQEVYDLLLSDYSLDPLQPVEQAVAQLLDKIWDRYRKVLVERNHEAYLRKLNSVSDDQDKNIAKDILAVDENLEQDSGLSSEITAVEMKDILDSAIGHVIRRVHRSRWLMRLMNCVLIFDGYDDRPEKMALKVSDGECQLVFGSEVKSPHIYNCFLRNKSDARSYTSSIDVECYDRLSVVYSELKRAVLSGLSVKVGLREKLWLNSDDLRDRLF